MRWKAEASTAEDSRVCIAITMPPIRAMPNKHTKKSAQVGAITATGSPATAPSFETSVAARIASS